MGKLLIDAYPVAREVKVFERLYHWAFRNQCEYIVDLNRFKHQELQFEMLQPFLLLQERIKMLKAVLASLVLAKPESLQTSQRLLCKCFHEVDEKLLIALIAEDLV